MSKRRASRDSRCPYCRINFKLCFCRDLKNVSNKTSLTIVMHHRESHLTSNTANLGTLTLQHFNIVYRGMPERPLESDHIIKNEKLNLFLFPDEDAIELNQEFLQNINQPIHLIIPDGTWRQAKKIKRREEIFSPIQSVKIPFTKVSEYQLRKAPREEGLSTFEAMARALGIIEGQDIEEQMMMNFKTMVNQVMKSRTAFEN